ncbi:hypothetical protein NBRC116583_01850 [Arenicella sp. 4NH20-0111]|uniref:phosphate ABC transporter substrate-binding/OmpA family protein n=1 Tax=Arenicella sp. 4NH20-0111 TaxID=3127648 RepID=UPI00310381CC
MGKHVKIASIFLFIGIVAIVGSKFVLPIVGDYLQTDSSDAKGTKGRITIGYDNWVGYFPLCSPEMKKRMRQSGYLLNCIDDGANYVERYAKLASGEYNFAVGTVDSYIVNGADKDYPGVITAVLDESKGGDAIVAWSDKITSLDDFKSNENLSIALTPDSPSEHLLKSVAVHFDIQNLRKDGAWLKETDGSSAALKAFSNKEVQAAVLWEPDVSRALSLKGVKRILSTKDTRQLIVDILITNRRYSQKNPEVVELLLKNYFRTLKYYRDDNDKLINDISKSTGLEKSAVENLLNGVSWSTLTDNVRRWYGTLSRSLSEEALIDTIESTIEILTNYGDIDRNPIPNQDPYRITNSEFVNELYKKNGLGGAFGDANKNLVSNDESLLSDFDTLSTKEWDRLSEIGTLKVRPIVFTSGTYLLTLEGKGQVDQAIENLKHYPNYRLEIRGHTGLRGDKKVNIELSSDRADSVKRYINTTYNVDKDRMRAIGFGGQRPLKKQSGESSRAYNYRLPRVEIVLVAQEL